MRRRILRGIQIDLLEAGDPAEPCLQPYGRDGFAAGVSFDAAFTEAQQSENERAEVEISFYQAAGSGATASVTLDVKDILTRLTNFTTIAHDNPFPFKAEIATYDTIPIPIPTPVEIEDFILSMSQDETKKLDYVKRRNDGDFALEHPEYFDNLPSATDLQAEGETYVQLINAVMDHQARLAKGQLQTAEVFDPAKVQLVEPAPRQFKRKATAPNLSINGVWRPDDNNFDVSQLKIDSAEPGQANVVVEVTFRHGQNAPIVKSTTATLDVGANMYRTPEIIKQVFEIQVFPDDPEDVLDQDDLQKVAFSNAIVDNKMHVIQTVVGQVNVPEPVSEVTLDTMFTRQL